MPTCVAHIHTTLKQAAEPQNDLKRGVQNRTKCCAGSCTSKHHPARHKWDNFLITENCSRKVSRATSPSRNFSAIFWKRRQYNIPQCCLHKSTSGLTSPSEDHRTTWKQRKNNPIFFGATMSSYENIILDLRDSVWEGHCKSLRSNRSSC